MLPVLLALAPALAEASLGVDEFRERLAQLSSPRAAERAAAERWLEAHLVRERYPDLAEVALAGDAEVRGRLVNVLASDGRYLGMALELCAEKDAGLAALGREAVRAGVTRFDPRLGETGLRERDELELVLREAASKSPPRHLRLDGRLPLEELSAQLDLVGELPLGLTLDVRVATRVIRREDELASGPWDELLLRVARALNVAVECHGIVAGREREVQDGAFLCLTSDADPPRTGAERIGEWLLVLATDKNEAARTRAARNLGSSGFTPAIEWMDHLLASRGDAAAREGLLRAAARGRAAPTLLEPSVFDALLAQAEAGPDSARILCALVHVGCIDARGAELAPRLFQGFAQASARARWARLLFLERSGCALSEAAAPARALLADPATPPALRLRALFWLGSDGSAGAGRPIEVRSEDLAQIVRLGLDRVDRERLGRVLALLTLPPPYGDPAAIPADWGARERLDLLQLWLWRGEAEAVAAHLAAWLRADAEPRGELLADELRPWLARGERALLERALASARAHEPALARAIDRVRLLLGLVPAASVQEYLATHRFVLHGPSADLALLGALAGYPVEIAAEAPAREQLTAALTLALQENRPLEASRVLVRALERALAGLYAAGREEQQGEALLRTVTQLARRNQKTALGRQLDAPLWPPAPGSEIRDLSRELARFEIPSF